MLKKDDASSDTQKISRRQIRFFTLSKKFNGAPLMDQNLNSQLRTYLCWKIDDELAPIRLRIIDDITAV